MLRVWRRIVAPAVAAALALPAASPGGATAAVPTDWVTDGPVYSIAHGGGRTYVGGDFTRVGPRTGHGVSLSPTTGAWLPGPAVPAGQPRAAEIAGGQVRTAISDGAGGWYVGGDFTHVGGLARRGLARIRSDGTVDPNFVAHVANSGDAAANVRALLLQPGPAGQTWLYVGGSFTQLGSSTVQNLGAVSPTTGATASWNGTATSNAAGEPAGGTVHALAGLSVTVAVDQNGTGNPGGEQNRVQSIVFAGGEFSNLGEQPFGAGSRLTVARVGAVWGVGARRTHPDPAEPWIDVAEQTVATSDAGGHWAPSTSASGTHVVRTLAVGTPVDVSGIRYVALYMGGEGTLVSGRTAAAATRFQLNQTAPASNGLAATPATYPWTPNPACDAAVCSTPSVHAIRVAGGSAYLGGEFSKVNGSTTSVQVERTRLAAYPVVPDPAVTSGSHWAPHAWSPSADGTVRGMSVHGGTVYLGGDFDQPRRGLAAFSSDPTAAAPALRGWNPDPSGGRIDTLIGGGIVNAVATGAAGQPVFAGGSFSSIRATNRNRLAAFESDGSLSSWHPDIRCALPPCEVRALAVAGGRVFAGGDFATVGGVSHPFVAAIDAASGTPAAGWNAPDPNWDVLALSFAGGRLYLGGAFTKLGAQPRRRVAALDAASGALLSFDASIDRNVYAVDADCDRVLVGGGFTDIDGTERSRIASLHPTSGSLQAWNPDAMGAVYDIERDRDTVYAAGSFALIGGGLRQKIAAVSLSTGKATDWNPAADATVRAIAISTDTVFAGGIFREIGGESRSRIAAISRATGDATSFRADTDTDAVVYAADISPVGVAFGGSLRHANAGAWSGLAGFALDTALPAGPCGPPPPAPVEEDPPPPPPPEPEPEPEPAREPAPRTVAEPPPDTDPPLIAGFRIKPRIFRAGRRPVLRWRLSEKVRYRIVVARVVRNRRGRRRAKRLGALRGKADAGVAKRRLRRRVRGKRLRPGRYRTRLVAVDAANNRSRSKVRRFRIKPRPRSQRTRTKNQRRTRQR